MEDFNWYVVVSGVLGFLSFIGGIISVKYVAVKKLLKDLAGALTEVSEAIEDDNVTQEEERGIVAAWRSVIWSAIALWRK